MAAPPSAKRLAADLIAQGIESKYLARVLAKVGGEDSMEQIEREFVREIATALGRSEDRVNLALAELELHRARYDRAVRDGASDEERQSHARAFNQQRIVAQTKLRDLLIHREAIGFRRNNMLNDLYPIPPKLKE